MCNPLASIGQYQKNKSQWRQADGNTVSYLTDPKFEPQTSHFQEERISARPTAGWILRYPRNCKVL